MIRKTPLLIAALALVAGFLAAEIFYPWKDTYIGSLDAAGWPGLVIAPAKDAAFALGVSRGIDPFMTLSFMSLPVIPTLRLTTRGVFDVSQQKYV